MAATVIGPVFNPHPTERQVRYRIHKWVQEYRFGFLRPVDDPGVNLMNTESSVTPVTDLERQVLDCLEIAIQEMVGVGGAQGYATVT